jgi:2-oxoglutarate ferredoxin oxidoreductase subunit alpha
MAVEADPVYRKVVKRLPSAVVRFVGDSGDGMQLAGMQFSNASAIFGNDIATFPDYPAEIRAPAGTLAGVSGFQINFSSNAIYTPGDRVQALVALNPAALKTNLEDLEPGGMLIVNEDAFDKSNLGKAGYKENPLENHSLDGFRLFKVPVTRLNRDAVNGLGLTAKAVDRCKNFFALGMVYWLFDRPMEPTIEWIREKFKNNPEVIDANIRSLKSGYTYCNATYIFPARYTVAPAPIAPGRYRAVTGNQATAWGLAAAAHQCKKTLFYGSYPITPASEILHELSRLKPFGVKTFQAEDEIAAIMSVIGASFGGALAATGTSGPGVSLKSEALGYAVMTELPLIIVDVQRGGPSTGLPTKTEQADLFMALFGRHGECPIPVIAPATPSDCFNVVIEAARIATRYMTPVFVLSEGYIANGSEPWRIPSVDELPTIDIEHPTDPDTFQPYARDERLSRPWALPGTPGLEHRLGGLEKRQITGTVSYDPENHEEMIRLRARKIENIADELPPLEVEGPESGELLVVSWGGTYGAVKTACDRVRASGVPVANAHFRYLHPLPKNAGEVLSSYQDVVVCERNLGQFQTYLRSRYFLDAHGFNEIRGRPFVAADIEEMILMTISELRL